MIELGDKSEFRKFIARLGALLLLMASSNAPAVVTSSLDFFLIDVNGQSQIVRQGEVLQVVRGDSLTIVKAALKGTDHQAEVVNLVGFVRPATAAKQRPLDQGDDRKIAIDTGDDLRKKYSAEGKGLRYRIVAESSSGPYGEAFVDLIDPEFRFAEVLVNDKLKIVRLGQSLDLVAADKIKVRRVVTNVFDLRSVRFQIETKNGQSQMQLFRGRNIFARIQLSNPLSEPAAAAQLGPQKPPLPTRQTGQVGAPR